MVRKLSKTLAERQRGHIPGKSKRRETIDWQTSRHYLYATGEMPQPGDIPNAQGVFVIRKGKTVRLHDILPEDWKKDFDPDDTVQDPDTSERLVGQHDGSTTVPGLIGFVDENKERSKNQKKVKAQKQAEKKTRRAAAAARSEESSKLSPYQRAINRGKRRQFIERQRERNAEVHDTRQNGVFWPGGYMAGRYYPPFTECFGPGVTRSDLHPMIAYWVSTMPAEIRVGADKTFVEPHWSKQQGLLFPYVEGDQKFCRWIFKDLDGAIYDNHESLVEALGKILKTSDEFKDDPNAKNLIPNLITGHTREDGRFECSHLIWLLERKSHVWTDLPWQSVDADGKVVAKGGDPRCRRAPVEKLKKVMNSLCKLLLPLGADPGQTNWRKPKAPTSPFISVIVANEDNLFELDDFAKIKNYPLNVNVKSMMRDAALLRAKSEGLDETLSNARWRKTRDITSAVALAARKNCDRGFTIAQDKSISARNPAPLAAWIKNEVRLRVDKEPDIEPGPGLDWVIDQQSVFAAKLYMTPKTRKSKRQPVRGRDRDHAVLVVEVDAKLSGDERASAAKKAKEDLKKARREAAGGHSVNDPDVVVVEAYAGLPVKERAAAERQAKKDVRTARRKEAGRRSGDHNGHCTFYKFKENVYTWVKLEGGDPSDWNTFRKHGLWAVSENTARKYWKRALAELFPQTQIGAIRYIADRSPVAQSILSRRAPVYIVLNSGLLVQNPVIQSCFELDPSSPDPGHQPSTAGPPDQRRPNHAVRPAAACPDAVGRVLEPA